MIAKTSVASGYENSRNTLQDFWTSNIESVMLARKTQHKALLDIEGDLEERKMQMSRERFNIQEEKKKKAALLKLVETGIMIAANPAVAGLFSGGAEAGAITAGEAAAAAPAAADVTAATASANNLLFEQAANTKLSWEALFKGANL